MNREELDKRYAQMNKVFAQRVDKDWCNTLQTEDDILRECVRLTESASEHFVESLQDESEPNDAMKKAVANYKSKYPSEDDILKACIKTVENFEEVKHK